MSDQRPHQASNLLSDLALNHAHRDFARALVGQTVQETLDEVQRSTLESRIIYFYAVDGEDRLQGVVPTRRLLLTPGTTPIAEIMERRIVTLPKEATMEKASEMFMTHRLLAIPITDPDGKIVGVIDVDQYADEIRQLDERQQSDEIFQLIGVRLARVQNASLVGVFRSRFPWLLCNIAGGVACAFIAGRFQQVLDQVVAIALFIPVVLALAESVSIQSLTLAFQLQRSRPAPWSAILRELLREARLGLLLGIACGVLVAGTAWLWQGRGGVAVCILVSISLCVMAAAAIGLLVPSLLHKAQRDPKVAAGPIALAMTDMVAITLYLGLAVWLL